MSIPPSRYGDAPNNQVSGQRIKTLTCPSDTPSTAAIKSHNYAINIGNTTFYQNPLNGVIPGGAPFTLWPRSWGPASGCMLATYGRAYPDHDGQAKCSPPFAGQPQAAIGQITDGTSNTFMAAEVIQGQGGDLRGFTWWGPASGFTTYNPPNANAPDVMRGGACNVAATYNIPCTTIATDALPNMMVARSKHSGGLNAVYCDGHVAFVTNNIDINTWRALSTSLGGEVVNPGP